MTWLDRKHPPVGRENRPHDVVWYAGNPEGMGEDGSIPNITPHETGIARWSERHLVRYLEFGMDPDGDFAGGSMNAVIQRGTSYLTDTDRRALAVYLRSLDPIEHPVD